MTTQPTTKAQSALDWLCLVLIIFGGLCLVASVPQTFTMVRVAHDEFGSAILVVVLEVMAFFALLAPLWVPSWTKTFDRIAYVLLGITTLGNYAGGWNYVWTHSEVGPFWLSIRDWREPIFSLPLATILLVGALSGLVPFAMKFFISLAIKRYRENELDRSPEAVAQRAIEPVLVQIIATRRLQEQLIGLTTQFSNQPLVLPNTQPTVKASASLMDLGIDVAGMERILAERNAQRQEGEQRHPFAPLGGLSEAEVADTLQAAQQAWTPPQQLTEEQARETVQAFETAYEGVGDDEDEFPWDEEDETEEPMTLGEAEAELAQYGWKTLSWEALELLGDRPEAIAEVERRRQARENLKKAAIRFGQEIGFLKPAQPTVEASDEGAAPEAEELPQATTEAPVALVEERQPAPEPTSASTGAVVAWECDGCGAEGTNGSKGKASSWSKNRGLDKLYCKACRDSGKYGK